MRIVRSLTWFSILLNLFVLATPLRAAEGPLAPIDPAPWHSHQLLTAHLDPPLQAAYPSQVLPNLHVHIHAPDGRFTRAQVYRQAVFREDADGGFSSTGPTSLAIRYTPRSAGVHRYEIRDHSGSVLGSGFWYIEEAASAQRLPLRRHETLPGRLARADGTVHIPVACNIAWAEFPHRAEAFAGYLERFAAHGGDHCRIWCASWSGQVSQAADTQLRLEHAWLLERMLAHCHRLDLTVTLVLDNHHDIRRSRALPGLEGDAFFETPLSDAYQERLAYLAARFGPDDRVAIWELCNEIDLAWSDDAEQPAERSATWIGAAAACLRRQLSEPRLISVSTAHARWQQIDRHPALDIVDVHAYIPPDAGRRNEHRRILPWLQRQLDRVAESGALSTIAEYGHHGSDGIIPGLADDPLHHVMTRGAWASLCYAANILTKQSN